MRLWGGILMAGSIFCEFFDNQTAFISKAARDWEDWHSPERLTEEWKLRHSEAMFVCDVQDLVQLCVVLTSSCDAVWRSAQKTLFENRSIDYQDYGKKIEFAFDAAIRAFGSVRSCIDIAVNQGCSIDNRTDFDDAENRVKLSKEHFFSRWPWIDKGVVKVSEGQYTNGEYQSLDEFLNEVQSNYTTGD
jgi:hypothetical protein